MMPADALRVLCVTPSGAQGRGGIDRLYLYMRGMSAGEAAQGVRIRYFASRGGSDILWPLMFPLRALAFAVLLVAWRPDVVHINLSTGASILRKRVLIGIAKLLGVKATLHFHGQFTAEGVANRVRWTHRLGELARRADCVIVLGEFYRRAFIETLGLPAEKLRILANGIPDFAADISIPKPRQSELRILFAGEVGQRKGADLLIDGLGRLAANTTAWTCTVAGNGDVERYKAMAEEQGVLEHVRFTGWIGASDLHHLMREADVVVLPSRSDAQPLSLLEGACAGAALVATPVGEVPEILQDEMNGIMIAPDAASLADALDRLIGRPDELAAMQEASRRIYLDRFGIGIFAANLRRTLRDLAVSGSAPAVAGRPSPAAVRSAGGS